MVWPNYLGDSLCTPSKTKREHTRSGRVQIRSKLFLIGETSQKPQAPRTIANVKNLEKKQRKFEKSNYARNNKNSKSQFRVICFHLLSNQDLCCRTLDSSSHALSSHIEWAENSRLLPSRWSARSTSASSNVDREQREISRVSFRS